jgi:hypothetical protein
VGLRGVERGVRLPALLLMCFSLNCVALAVFIASYLILLLLLCCWVMAIGPSCFWLLQRDQVAIEFGFDLISVMKQETWCQSLRARQKACQLDRRPEDLVAHVSG